MSPATAVGRDVESWCTRCKLILAHTVESMIAGKITRVHCNTCRSQHAYRPHPPGDRLAASPTDRPVRARATRAPAKSARTGVARKDDYAALVSGRDPAKARAYATADRFAPKDLILHPSFGLGVVMVLKDRTKIDVLFRDGVKTLLHSN